METQNTSAEVTPEVTPDQIQEAKLARRCFNAIDRLTQQMLSYPPGHPAIENALTSCDEAFREVFNLTDRITVSVMPHHLEMMDSKQEVWETDEPRDYCFILSRDGVFLLHLLAGIDRHEVKKFVDTLNFLLENRDNVDVNSTSVLFDAGFRYISYDALDESLAALAGIDLDTRNKDTKEEKELIEELFNQAFEADEGDDAAEATEGEFEIRVQNPAVRMKKIDVGSREFLALDDEAQQHLLELKLGFTEHAELEHREGEILSALLGAKPKQDLRVLAVEQIGQVMSELLRTEQPWEALTFLKIIHRWRDKFASEVSGELKSVVAECFDRRRIQELVRKATIADTKERRMILQMFNALHLDSATEQLAYVVGWNLEEEARGDFVRYLKERSRYGFDFLMVPITKIEEEYLGPVFEILEGGMPKSRDVAIELLKSEVTPPVKARAMQILAGSWSDSIEVRDLVVPLVSSTHSELRLEACRAVAESTPQHIVRVMGPLFSDQLRKRPDEEVRELAQIFVQKGGKDAVAKIKEIVHRRGLTTSEQERELAVTVAKALIRAPHPAVIKMLDEVSKDWLVPQRIRSTCKEIAGMLGTGN